MEAVRWRAEVKVFEGVPRQMDLFAPLVLRREVEGYVPLTCQLAAHRDWELVLIAVRFWDHAWQVEGEGAPEQKGEG